VGVEHNTRGFLENLQKKFWPTILHTVTRRRSCCIILTQASFPVAKVPDNIENRTIPARPDGKDISITIVRPPNSSNETLPVVMYFHGGGWILGGFDTHDRLVRELANKANVAVVFVNYTRFPEAKYPVALEEAMLQQNGLNKMG
jgi:acetyl esterase